MVSITATVAGSNYLKAVLVDKDMAALLYLTAIPNSSDFAMIFS